MNDNVDKNFIRHKVIRSSNFTCYVIKVKNYTGVLSFLFLQSIEYIFTKCIDTNKSLKILKMTENDIEWENFWLCDRSEEFVHN